MNDVPNETEIEKLTSKEIALMVVGVLLGLSGGMVSDYITMFHKEIFLKNPFGFSLVVVFVVSVFVAFIFMLLHTDLWKSNFLCFAVIVLKKVWKSCLFIVVPLCALILLSFCYGYQMLMG